MKLLVSFLSVVKIVDATFLSELISLGDSDIS